ncbi:PAS domain-containing protein, partial [Azospirillum brasilense]|nr:PAS domain-containing protein [Azospirillum brasilense]
MARASAAAPLPRRPARPRAPSGSYRPVRSCIDPSVMLNALPDPVLVVDGSGDIRYVNLEAQEFFGLSAAMMEGMPLAELLPPNSPVSQLIEQVQQGRHRASQEGVVNDSPRLGPTPVTVRVPPLGDPPDPLRLPVHERTTPRRRAKPLPPPHP